MNISMKKNGIERHIYIYVFFVIFIFISCITYTMLPVLQEKFSAYSNDSSSLISGKDVSSHDEEVEEGNKILLYVNIIFLEFPFFLFVSIIWFFPMIKNRIVRYLFPIINVIIFYLSFDVLFHFHDRYPQPSDLKNINTIFDFSPLFAFIIFLFVIIIPVGSLVITVWHAIKSYNLTTFIISFFSRFAILFAVVMIISSSIFADYYTKIFNFVYWSPVLTVRRNGRLATFLYYGIKEKQCKKLLISYKKKDINIHKILYPDFNIADTGKLKNIHLVVLESFIDPRLLKNVQFNRSPLADELIPFMNKNGEFSLVESPVYGGRTAQAEFELLTGIKALAKVDSIEFNVMMGDYASSFVQRLKKLNYRAVATIASSSVYFNEKRAYKSLGFNEVSFLAEEDAFKDRGDHDHPIFDADVFQYNLKKIRSLLIDRKGPLFNYVVGLYGHIPYVKVDEHRDVIITSRSESNINKISNQFYYRTKALADYLDEIRKIDPDSITVIVSDHIPPVLSKGSVEYKFDKKINIAIVRNSGKNFPISGKKYFQIPWLIWSFLSKTNNDIHIDDQVMEEIYFKLLSETIHDDD